MCFYLSFRPCLHFYVGLWILGSLENHLYSHIILFNDIQMKLSVLCYFVNWAHLAFRKFILRYDKKLTTTASLLSWCKIITSVLIKTSAKVGEPPQPQQSAQAVETGIEVAVLALERRPAPSLAELDSSSSFSSMDEDNDSDPESMTQAPTHFYQRPPLVRSRGRGGLHRMSEAFVCFFAPDKRLTRLVEELSRDRRSIFGGMVQDFLLAQREVLKSLASSSSSSSSSTSHVTSVQLLQGLRLFLSQARCCLLDSGELEPPIETLVPENEKGTQTHYQSKTHYIWIIAWTMYFHFLAQIKASCRSRRDGLPHLNNWFCSIVPQTTWLIDPTSCQEMGSKRYSRTKLDKFNYYPISGNV